MTINCNADIQTNQLGNNAVSRLTHWNDILIESVREKKNPRLIEPKKKKHRYYLNGDFDGIYLTKREWEVLITLLKGYSIKEIALEKSISYRTVEDYVRKLKIKLGYHHKQQLLRELLGKNYLSCLLTIQPSVS